jgi:hypothetical protein
MDARTRLTPPMFERRHHWVTDVRSGDARGGGKEARCNPAKRDPDHLAVVTADLEAVETSVKCAPLLPTAIRRSWRRCNDHPVDPFVIVVLTPQPLPVASGWHAPADSYRSAARRSPR